jgi:hypothetical protein
MLAVHNRRQNRAALAEPIMPYTVVLGRSISIRFILVCRGIALGSESKEFSSCAPMKLSLTFWVCALGTNTEGFNFVCRLLGPKIPIEVLKFRLEDRHILLILEHCLLPNG